MRKLKGIFLSHHEGFLHEARQSFTCLKNIEMDFRFIFHVYELDSMLFNLGREAMGDEQFMKHQIEFNNKQVAPLVDELRPIWLNKIMPCYQYLFEALCDWNKYDFVIFGLSPFLYDCVRKVRPDIPVIFYPRMTPPVYEVGASGIDQDDNFIYVTNEKYIHEHYDIFNNRKLIPASLNPKCYGPYDGSIPVVVTFYNYLDASTDPNAGELFADWLKEPKVEPNSYLNIVKDIKHSLYGRTNTRTWGGAIPVSTENVPEVLRLYRCALAYSRTETAIATAQILASGVPIIGWVDSTNELRRYIKHGESGFITRKVKEAQSIIKKLISDHGMAKEIGAAGRQAYYEYYPWNKFKSQWEKLINSMVNKANRKVVNG